MPNELALKAISYGLIWFSFLLLLVALLVSQRKEYDQVSRQVFPFTIAMISLWALIALGIIYTQSEKTSSLDQSSNLGESQARVATQAAAERTATKKGPGTIPALLN